MRSAILRTLFLVALLGVWQATVSLFRIPNHLLPAPSDVWVVLKEASVSMRLPLSVLVSLKRLVIGYGLSVVVGVPLGIALTRLQILTWTLGSVIAGLQALPSICWLPLALLWFGLSENAILFVIVLGASMSIVSATEDAIRNVPPAILRAGQMMGARAGTLYFRVLLPAAFPGILIGLKLGWVLAWRALMAGELLFVAGGLGQFLHTGRELNDMAQVIAAMLTIAACGLSFDRLLIGKLETVVRARWGLDRA